MNTAAIAGRLAPGSPRLRYTESAKPELALTLVCEEVGRDGRTFKTYVPIIILGPRAESWAEVLEPGNLITVSGKLAYKRVTTKTGEESKLCIVAFDVERLAPSAAEMSEILNDSDGL